MVATRQKAKGAKSLDRKPRKGQAEAATQRAHRKKFANSRNALQRTADLAFLARWRLRGLNLDALHIKLNEHLSGLRKVSRAQVGVDLKAVDQAWREEREQNITHLRDRELARLEADEHELVEAWEKSKKNQGKRRVKQVRDGTVDKKGVFAGDEKTEKTFDDADSYGDPAIYAQILAVRSLRAKICGWTAPVRVQHSGHDGGPLPVGAGAAPIINLTIAAPRDGEAVAVA